MENRENYPKIDNKSVAARLRRWIEETFRSKVEFAERLGTSGATVHGWIKPDNPVMPGGDFLLKIAELGGDLNWLLTGAEPLPKEQAGIASEPPTLERTITLNGSHATITIDTAQNGTHTITIRDR